MKEKKKAQINKKAGQKEKKGVSHIFILAAILLVTLFAFSKSVNNSFVTWDDPEYVTENDLIKDFSFHGIKEMFTSYYGGNYHPLTALSNAIEYHFFKLNPKPYHVVNLILHLFNIVLVFLFIRKLSVMRMREDKIQASNLQSQSNILAGIVAALFAVHPMHVESVVWIAERKDVLYTFFYLGSLIAYLKYIELSGSKLKFFISIGLFVLSLLSKSMAVTLPVVLVLIDYYTGRKINLKTILEKIPFFILSIIFGIVALKSQSSSGATELAPHFPFYERILLSCYGLVYYLFRLFIPGHLSAFHPYPSGTVPLSIEFYLAPVVLLLFVFLIYKARYLKRELIFGALFFITTISIVIQLFPVGHALMAERYTYVPYIGLFFIFGSFYNQVVEEWTEKRKALKPILLTSISVIVILFSMITHNRIEQWKDGIILFTDVIEKYPSVDFAYYNRGKTKNDLGDYKGAIEDYTEAIRINPEYVQAFYNRGFAKGMYQDFSGSIPDFDQAIKLYPAHFMAYNNRGNAKGILKDYQSALKDFDEAIRIKPDYAEAYFNRGLTELNLGMKPQACEDWQKSSSMGYEKSKEMVQKFCL